MQDIIATITNGRLPEQEGAALGAILSACNGHTVRIEVKQWKPTRSNKQSRYYWGVVVKIITAWMRDLGNEVGPEEVHHFLKTEVGKLTKAIVKPGGGHVIVVDSTTKLTTEAMESYLEQCRAFAARYEVTIPLPNEPTLTLHDFIALLQPMKNEKARLAAINTTYAQEFGTLPHDQQQAVFDWIETKTKEAV